MTRLDEISGYGFAYFAWMRTAPFDSYRCEAAASGSTFFMLFNHINRLLP